MRRGIAGTTLVICMLAASQASAASLQQQLLATDGIHGDNLGTAVAIDGDTAVVGAQYANGGAGAVYEFQRSGDTWQLVAKLTASNAQPNDNLGHSVAIDGDVIAAGAPSASVPDPAGTASEGLVYTFARTGPVVRTETSRLYALAAGSVSAAQVGFSVAIDGDEIVAGAIGMAGGQGTIFRFPSTGGPIINEFPGSGVIHASDGTAGDALGWSVAIDGDEIVGGAPDATVAGHSDQGAAYTFPRTGATTETSKLIASDGTDQAFLGGSVAIDGDTVVAGAGGANVDSSTFQGAGYTFARAGGSPRTETSKLIASDGSANDGMGVVAISGDTIAIGASGDNIGTNADQGSVSLFPRAGTGTRSESSKLTASDGAPGDQFGATVAMSGTTIIAGAPNHDVGSSTDQGAAGIFYDPAPVLPPPPPQPPAADTTPPTLDLTAATSEKIRRTIKFSATCDEACSLTVNGSVKPKHDDRSQLKPMSVQLGAGVTTTIKVKLGRLKHALENAGSGKAKLSVVATDAAGNAAAPGKAKIKLD